MMGKVIKFDNIALYKSWRAKADACRLMAERYYLEGDMENFAAWADVTRTWYKKANDLVEGDDND